MNIDIADVELGYLDCALWSSTGDDDQALDVLGVEARLRRAPRSAAQPQAPGPSADAGPP